MEGSGTLLMKGMCVAGKGLGTSMQRRVRATSNRQDRETS